MADALGSVIVIISALIMWFLPSQVLTLVLTWASTYFNFQEENENGDLVDVPENQWTK